MFLQANITVVDSFKIKYKLYTFFFVVLTKALEHGINFWFVRIS
jgi:hypothetical protein